MGSNWRTIVANHVAITSAFKEAHPNSNLGIRMGPESGVLCVDLDTNHGACASDLDIFPRTWRVKSRLGWHIYFKWTDRLTEGLRPLFGGSNNKATAHVRGVGHYFVAPPSVVAWDEKTNEAQEPWEYVWDADAGGELRPGECELAEAPAWMLRCFDEKKPFEQLQDDDVEQSAKQIVIGERHHDLLTYGRWLWDHREDETVVATALRKRNLSYAVPKDEALFERELANLLHWFRTRIGAMGTKAALKVSEPTLVATTPETTEAENLVRDSGNKISYAGHTLWFLGYAGERFYYSTSQTKEVVALSASAHSWKSLASMCTREWYAAVFGTLKKTDGPNWEQAASAMMARGRQRGRFDLMNLRGPGCSRDNGAIVYNSGQMLWVNGEPVDIHEVQSELVYTAARNVGALSERIASEADVADLTAALNCAYFENKSSVRLLTGAIALCRVAGALPWRPHVWITGPKGSGKTTLMNLVKTCAGKCVGVAEKTSAAALRAAIGTTRVPVIYEEAESHGAQGEAIMRGVVELARFASTETDFAIIKSSVTGDVREYRVASMFIMNAIRVTLPEESDASRFAVLRTVPIAKGEAGRASEQKMREINERITPEFGDRLFARMYGNFDRLLAVFKQLRSAIALQTDNRTGDTYGMLLAGWWVATNCGVPTAADVEEAVASLQLEQRQEEDDRQEDHVECLQHVTDRTLRYEDINGVAHSMGVQEMVQRCRIPGRDVNADRLRAALMRSGMYADERSFLIRARNPETEALYRGSKWEGKYAQAYRACPEWKIVRRRFMGQPPMTWYEIPYALSFGVL